MRVVCIQADADRFHVSCAKKIYSEKTINIVKQLFSEKNRYDIVTFLQVAPRDNEGNPIIPIEREEWDDMKEAARYHHETIYDSCGHCLGRIR